MITSTLVTPENPQGLIDETDESLYDKTVITWDNKNELTVATEYRLLDDPVIIHRSVNMTLKRMPVETSGVAADFA